MPDLEQRMDQIEQRVYEIEIKRLVELEQKAAELGFKTEEKLQGILEIKKKVGYVIWTVLATLLTTVLGHSLGGGISITDIIGA